MKNLPYDFWEKEAALLYEVIIKYAWQMAKLGTVEGYNLLGAEIDLDWDLINDYARAWSVVHTAEVVAKVSTTSMETFVKLFPGWVESGAHLDELIKQLTPIYKSRARIIAATETTRAYAQGNLITWGAAGVINKVRWYTANDERVCPICGELNGKETALGENFPGYNFNSPPAHPNCRCWIQPVV